MYIIGSHGLLRDKLLFSSKWDNLNNTFLYINVFLAINIDNFCFIKCESKENYTYVDDFLDYSDNLI